MPPDTGEKGADDAARNPVRGPRPGHEPSSVPGGEGRKTGRFVTTVVEVEGREETKVVEKPDFEPEPWTADAALTIVGTNAPRVDALEKTTGRARYTADVRRPRMAWAVLVRATVARGRVTRVDTEAARALPGVLDVITAADLAGVVQGAGARALAVEVLYAGQPVAAVCAEDERTARRAADLVRLEIEPLPFAVTVADSLAPGAPSVRGGRGNAPAHSPLVAQRGDVDAALAAGDLVVVRGTFRTPVALHTALEPHGAVAEWEGDRLVVWESTQGVFRTRANLASAFRLPMHRVRVQCEFMGGGFGAKSGAGAHTYVAAALARRLDLPVRCVLDREGEQTDTGNRPATVQDVTLAATGDGRLVAIALDAEIPLGVAGWEGGPGKIYHELYSCPNVRTRESYAYVNAPAMSAFRAPGHAEGCFGLERAMDMLARALAIDPVELRLRNAPTRDEEKNREYSDAHRLAECLRVGAERFGWEAANGGRRTADGAPRGRSVRRPPSAVRRGTGVAAQTWGTGGGPPAYALVRLNPDGTADVLTGTQDLGTGSRTILAQVAAEALGQKLDAVRCVIGDTERLPYTGVSWGSMTTPSVAPAVRMAAEDARRQLFEAAAQLMDVPFDSLSARDGVLSSPAAERTMTFADVGRRLGEVMIIGRGSRGPNPPKTAITSVGAQFAEVEVDVETGVVRVLRVTAVHDAGRIINPTLAGSQLEGGILQGLGYALFEERVMDVRLGLILNPTVHDYKIPTMADVPAIDASCLAGADPVANHVGARGLAEPPIIPTAPAIANAVADALGVEPDAIPMTPWRVLGWGAR